MTKHVHAEMIKAKADNMEQVVFVKCGKSDKWKETETPVQFPLSEFDDVDYFLCLPQHKEAGLHWLNGGYVQLRHGKSQDWEDYGAIIDWVTGSVFMQCHCEIRIKSRKEKRWIAFKWDNFYVLPRHYETKKDAEIAAALSMMGEFQYKEIEVEI